MALYTWDPPVDDSILLRDGREYRKGDQVDLTESEAVKISASWVVPLRRVDLDLGEKLETSGNRSTTIRAQVPVLLDPEGKPFGGTLDEQIDRAIEAARPPEAQPDMASKRRKR